MDTSKIDGNEKFIISKSYNNLERFLYFLKHKRVYDDLKKNNLDFELSHAHSLFSNGYIAYKLKKDYSIPYIVTSRRSDLFIFTKYKPYLIPLAAKILNEAEKCIYLSESAVDKAEEVFGRRVLNLRDKKVVLPNGIENVFLENIFYREKSKDLNESTILIMAGKLDDKNKNLKTLIEVLSILRDKDKSFKLLLVGRLEDPLLKEMVDKNPNIIYKENTRDYKKMISYYRMADIYVMPSFTETFGLVYAEALSQGLPVIYTKNQGFDKQFPDGHVGFAIDPNSAYDICEKILKVKGSYYEISKRASVGAQRYNWDRIAGEYEKIYKEIILRK